MDYCHSKGQQHLYLCHLGKILKQQDTHREPAPDKAVIFYLEAAAAIVPPMIAPARAPIEMAAAVGAGSTTTTGAGGGGGQG